MAGGTGQGPPIRERHLEVRRSARLALLGEPGPRLREVWVVCHGYRQLARHFVRSFLPLAAPSRLFVAPEGLSRFYLDEDGGPHGPEHRVGATWMTREDRLAEIEDYVAYLDAVHDWLPVERGSVRVRALGFSQGAATVSRWAALGSASLDQLVLWSGTLPPDLDLDAAAPRLRTLDLHVLHGSADRYADAAALRRERERLATHGIPATFHAFDGGHRVEPEPLRWLAARPS